MSGIDARSCRPETIRIESGSRRPNETGAFHFANIAITGTDTERHEVSSADFALVTPYPTTLQSNLIQLANGDIYIGGSQGVYRWRGIVWVKVADRPTGSTSATPQLLLNNDDSIVWYEQSTGKYWTLNVVDDPAAVIYVLGKADSGDSKILAYDFEGAADTTKDITLTQTPNPEGLALKDESLYVVGDDENVDIYSIASSNHGTRTGDLTFSHTGRST